MRKNKLIAFFKSGQSLLRCVQPPVPEVCTQTIYLKENRVFINNALDSLNLSSNKFILVYLSRLLSVLISVFFRVVYFSSVIICFLW